MAKKAIPISEWSKRDFANMFEWVRDLALDLESDEGPDHDDMIGVTDHVAKVRGLAEYLRVEANKRPGCDYCGGRQCAPDGLSTTLTRCPRCQRAE
jgi:hypothetical protein